MGNVLNMNTKLAMTKLTRLSKGLSKEYNVPFGLDKNMSIFDGKTYSNDNGFATEVKVGIGQFRRGLLSVLQKSHVEDADFARVVLNMYHEAAHCVQKNDLFRQSDLDGSTKNQLVQEIARRGNSNYYFDDGNYSVNASEIQAEHYGIMNAYEYLKDEFKGVDSNDIESIMVSIVNDKMKNTSYFLKEYKEFTSLKEIDDAFDDTYDKSFTKDRWYYVENEHTSDVVKQYMQKHKDAHDVYLSLHDPLEKDRCIAAINLRLHPEWLEQYPALKDMDLSYERVIEDRYAELVNKGKAEPEKIYERTYEEARQRNFGTMTEPVKVPVHKHYDEKDLKGLSRMEQLEMKFGHLMQEETTEDEYEK